MFTIAYLPRYFLRRLLSAIFEQQQKYRLQIFLEYDLTHIKYVNLTFQCSKTAKVLHQTAKVKRNSQTKTNIQTSLTLKDNKS